MAAQARAARAATPAPLVVHLVQNKETKGTIRYQEVNDRGVPISLDADGAVLQSSYLRKEAIKKWLGKGPAPKSITITITANE